MRPVILELPGQPAPELVVQALGQQAGTVLLRSSHFESSLARYSFLAARPFLVFRSWGSRCELQKDGSIQEQYGNPWRLLDALMTRYELLDEMDLPFPLGGCFGFWGYDLKNFVEPRLKRNAVNDLALPECWVGFYSSLLVYDHRLEKLWIIATGLGEDGARSRERAEADLHFWQDTIAQAEGDKQTNAGPTGEVTSSFSRGQFVAAVQRAQEFIRQGDIYQVNLSHRLQASYEGSGWSLFNRLIDLSPAPFAAYLHAGEFELCSSSPELFLRMSGAQIVTRPIKGTRPRAADPLRDAQLSYELQTSAKEISELVMITDLLRNDLGRVCEFGTVQVPDLVRLEKYPQVQHLVSTVEGRLRPEISHFAAFASCFPGGSITGAPKIRAMEIIDELEPVSRGPYTGAFGYLGFNRESQLSILIRTAIKKDQAAYFNVGAGIVADSDAGLEYEETLAKAAGFLKALASRQPLSPDPSVNPRSP